jgi:hypothetical protein
MWFVVCGVFLLRVCPVCSEGVCSVCGCMCGSVVCVCVCVCVCVWQQTHTTHTLLLSRATSGQGTHVGRVSCV